MTLNEIKKKLNTEEYGFLKNNEHLLNNIAILTLGGSHAYGTNNENSDLDIRGVALNSKREILTNENFDQFCNSDTDTTIYSFNKLIKLLINCNPNTIEMLGNKPEHYFHVSKIGQELLNNKKIFLSKRAIYSFGGYATQQLRRLVNKSNRLVSQPEQEQHILNTIKDAEFTYKERYFDRSDDSIKLYIDKAYNEDYESEIYMDVNLQHYPLRDYKGLWSEMQNIVKSYSKIGSRNEKAIEHNKLAKHMMHLIRLYMMCIDILEKEEIVTYREKEHDLLMDIRNSKFLDSNQQPLDSFYDLLNEYESKYNYAKEHTNLPDNPDYNKVNGFVMSVNERIVKGEID